MRVNCRSQSTFIGTAEERVFRFTIIWEKIIVIIGENWTEVLVLIQEQVESRVA